MLVCLMLSPLIKVFIIQPRELRSRMRMPENINLDRHI